MPIDLERMRAAARRAALVGGDVIRAGRRPSEGEAKGLPGDWVTEVDLASEAAIRSFLDEETPDVAMLGEESGGVTEGLRWVVDPLDGTTNFLHRFPAVGVSVALVEDEVPDGRRNPCAVPGRYVACRAWRWSDLGTCRRGRRNRAACRSVRRSKEWSGRDSPSAGRTGFRDTSPRSARAFDRFEDLRRPGRGMSRSRLGRVRGLRRLLRAGARAVGRRGGRPPGGGSGRTRHRLGGRCRLSVGRHPGWLAGGP